MWDEFENALAWYGSAPKRWVKSAKQDLTAAAEWIWGVLQGDFNEEASTAQTVTSTVISMIPFVDQICDVRDVVANCKNIHKDRSNIGGWIALALTLLGLFPTLGSLAKGCGKILFGYARKAANKTGGKVAGEFIEAAIKKLNQFLVRPEVIKALKALKVDNPYRYLAQELRKVSAKINVSNLLAAFDKVRKSLDELIDLVKKWGSTGLAGKAVDLLKIIDGIRKQANEMLAKALKPVQDWVDALAKRLDVEADNLHPATVKAKNAHVLVRPTNEAEEIKMLADQKPTWWRTDGKQKYSAYKKDIPKAPGWPDFEKSIPCKDGHKTFHTLAAVEIPPGEKLYRIVAPGSSDNSICWMRESEFLKLKSRDDWRKNFAVWKYWNSNGEYVVYTVPHGKPLKVWEGKTASQVAKGKPNIVLDGGGIQIVLEPADLVKDGMSKRHATNWGYTDFDGESGFIGVPLLTNYWREKK